MSFPSAQELESHLATRSYVDGFTPSQSDVVVFKSLAAAPSASEFPHTARWYSHIQTFSAEHDTLGGGAFAAKLFGAAPSASSAAPAAAPAAAAAADDEDIDLFGSDDEEDDAEAERIKAERVAAYNEKKAGKAKVAAKSVVTLEVKPWDDTTDMAELEKNLRAIEQDGLVWGLSKLVPVGYGVNKLQITLVIEDEKVSLDDLQDRIAEDEDHVQSSDIAAMQKL